MTAPYEELTTDQRIKRAGLVGASFYGTTLQDSFTKLVITLCENAYRQGYNDAQRIAMGVYPVDLEWDVQRRAPTWNLPVGSKIDLP